MPPKPEPDYTTTGLVPASTLDQVPFWSGNAKIKTSRGKGAHREFYIEFAAPSAAGWVPMASVPPSYRRSAAASAGRQDRVRRRDEGLEEPLPMATGSRGKKRAREEDEGVVQGQQPARRHRPMMLGEELGQGLQQQQEAVPGAVDGLCGECAADPGKAVLTGKEMESLLVSRVMGMSVCGLEICIACALAEGRKKDVLLYAGYRDCRCVQGVGCAGCFADKMRVGVAWRSFKLALSKYLGRGGEENCFCGRQLDGSGVWICEICGGIGVLCSGGVFPAFQEMN